MKIENCNLIPDNVIDSFCKRIEYRLNIGHKIYDKSIQDEIDRIISLNGFVPEKILNILNKNK